MASEPYSRQADELELSIVMPCLNEAETLAICIDKAKGFLQRYGVDGEVVIADNGSTDGSQQIATEHGARVVNVETKGYGAALMGGIQSAEGRFVIMADADDSYDFSALDLFVDKLRDGFDLVMGNRFLGGIKPGAMPPLHRYLGNPVLTGIGKLFFGSKASDFHCGLRGFRREAILALGLETSGMEFASEMVVKATLHGLNVVEVPTTLSPDGRSRAPHLRSWRDGWRHLRFLMIYSPRWTFLYPGMLLALVGILLMLWLIPQPRQLLGLTLDIHSLLYASAATLLGLQAVSFALFSKVFAVGAGLLPPDDRVVNFMRRFTLEKGLVLGLLLLLGGIIGSLSAVWVWGGEDLNPAQMMRLTIPSLTALAVGAQLILTSFFLGILGLAHK
ncbi:glycosyltransferase family 2 protein [Aestuariirhabdus sp. LZHN29]|uniref:glycosyltransferase family 2 protein n=1 Tax=Aestuariirhabdus sp. LZHN29 TaxID=3417462 RepID=UPI003CEECD9D